MTYAELLGQYFERSNALQWYWTLYVVIIGGLLAFSSLRQRGDLITTLLISVLFCFFAYKNHGAIIEVTNQRLAMLEVLKQNGTMREAAGPVAEKVLPTLKPALPESITPFHITCDVLTVAALWAMELRRRRSAVVVEAKA